MQTAIKTDLTDICESLEHILKNLNKLTQKEKIDLGARLRAAIKTASQVDEIIKAEIKAKKEKSGYVLGEQFKACLSMVPTTRLDAGKVQAEYPAVYAKCLSSSLVTRITYEPR